MAREALALHLEGLEAEGEAWPEPCALEDIMALADSRGAAAILVPAPKPKSRAVRINITVDENLLEEIDAAAGPGARSGFLSQAARVALARSRKTVAKRKTVKKMSAERPEPKKAVAEKKSAKRRIAVRRRKGKPASAKRRTRA